MVGQIAGGECLKSVRHSGLEIFENLISAYEHDKLIEYENSGSRVARAAPPAEDYLPLLFAPALQRSGGIFNDAVDLGSISMTSVKIR